MARGTRINRHVHVTESVRNGKSHFVLLSDDGFLSKFFDNWSYQLSRSHPFNTVKSYALDVCILLNFIFEYCSRLLGITPVTLSNALESFEEYLVFGVNSDEQIIREVAIALGATPVSGATASRYIVSANKFIDASEEFRLGMLQLESLGYVPHSYISVFPQGLTFEGMSPGKVRAAIRRNSWFAGCLAGGARRLKCKNLKPKSKPSLVADTDEHGGDGVAFPLDLAVSMIEGASCTRDALLYSGAAAFGPRIVELLTLTFDDVKCAQEKIYIVDPQSRQRELSQWLPADEVKKISHKARATPETYGIEPFASHFWVLYAQYYEEVQEFERANPFVPRHRFVFRKLEGGEPLVNSYQSVYERFREAAFKVTGHYYTPHSMRHMYGYYLVNFCPNPSDPKRFGLPIRTVQKFMGHRELKSTMKYARKDARMLEATLSALNSLRMGAAGFSVSDVRFKHVMQLKNDISEILMVGDK